jgi:hypothetical protein
MKLLQNYRGIMTTTPYLVKWQLPKILLPQPNGDVVSGASNSGGGGGQTTPLTVPSEEPAPKFLARPTAPSGQVGFGTVLILVIVVVSLAGICYHP